MVDGERREHPHRIVGVVHRQTELLEVVGTLNPPCRLADFLHGRQQEADEDGDDGDHDEQLDQGEGPSRQTILHGVAPSQGEYNNVILRIRI